MSRPSSALGTPRSEDFHLKGLCRKIAPYIVHKWKDVCDELGVMTRDILHVQSKHTSGATLSDQAFQGLCCWLDQSGKYPTKDRLLRALQVCGLRRAEEELSSLTQIKLPFGYRPTTSQPREKKRISKQQAFINRMAIPRPASSRPKYLLHGPKKPKEKKKVSKEICELRVTVTVARVIQVDEKKDDSEKSDYKHTCHAFCKRAMSNTKHKLEKMHELLNIHGLSIQRIIRLGFSIHIFFLFSTLGAMELFYQMMRSGRLKWVISASLVKDTYVQQTGATVDLGLQIDEGLINKYRDILMARIKEESPKVHPTDELPSLKKTEDPPKKVDQNFSVKVWRRELDWEIDRIEARHNSFQDQYSDMLMTLRIVKPTDAISGITTLGDVIMYYEYMKKSPGTVSKNVRMDLVREYIAIINKIRLLVADIRENEVKVSMDQSIKPATCEVFHLILQRLEEMLKPEFKFRIERDVSKQKGFGGVKEDSFTGLISYIPTLIGKLTVMNERLSEI